METTGTHAQHSVLVRIMFDSQNREAQARVSALISASLQLRPLPDWLPNAALAAWPAEYCGALMIRECFIRNYTAVNYSAPDSHVKF